MHDDHDYTITTINGYRRGCLTFKQAVKHRRDLQASMIVNGWSGKVFMYYNPSGREVDDQGRAL